jgi:hypothetical protein
MKGRERITVDVRMLDDETEIAVGVDVYVETDGSPIEWNEGLLQRVEIGVRDGMWKAAGERACWIILDALRDPEYRRRFKAALAIDDSEYGGDGGGI